MKEYLDKNINYMEGLNKVNNLSTNGKIELSLLKDVKKQLIITDVSQQRELLIAYELENWEGSEVIQEVVEERVDLYLSNL